MLTPMQKTQYQQDGYLVLPGFKSASEIAALRARAAQIVDAFDPRESMAIFSTKEQSSKVDDYFMGSADTVRCFFEEEAFDAAGQLKQDKSLSINKIGHAMHDLDPVFHQFSRGPALAQLATDLGLEQPQIWQSMYIFKQPGIGGEVRWHQDATFFDTTPMTVTTFWFALEDATVANGCLWAEPGGHRGPLRERFVTRVAGSGSGSGAVAQIEKLNDAPWPDDSTAVPLEVAAGTLVVFHGLLPHYSAPNRSSVSRHAYTLHATDGRSAYSPRNWLQRTGALPVRGFDSEF
jgi:phytanoyl-CoA hydroxylase